MGENIPGKKDDIDHKAGGEVNAWEFKRGKGSGTFDGRNLREVGKKETNGGRW